MRRRDLIHDGTVFAVTAFADPVLASLTGVVERIRDDSTATVPTATMIRDMTDTFRRLDARFGSAEIRDQVVTFLHNRASNVAHTSPDAGTYSALGELTQFAGWLAQDCDLHGIAQRYYVQALGLAEHADDPMLASWVLAAMSDQAGRLGHRRHSLAMARAAVRRADNRAAPAVTAMVHDKLAWALARNGDEAGLTAALAAMEQAIGRADGDKPSWAAHFNPGDVAECQGHCFALLGKQATATAKFLESRRAQAPERARTRSFAEAGLALVNLQGPRPDLDAALDAGRRALSLAGQLNSRRVTAKLAELDTALGAFPYNVAVREWRTQLHHLGAPTTGAGSAGGAGGAANTRLA